MVQTASCQIDLMYESNRAQLKFGWNDYDPKSLEFGVTFPQPFAAPPLVLLSLTELQTDSTLALDKSASGDPYTNLAVKPDSITATGFYIILTVRRNNSIGLITVSWLALEP